MKKKIILILCLAVMLTAFLSYSVFADEVDLVENVEKIEITEEFGENEAIEKAGAYLYSKIEITDKGEVVPLEDVIFEGSFSDVADYLNYSKKGGIIVLKENVKLEKNITLQSVDDTVAYIVVQGDNVFFDLNGYVLTQQSGYKESLNSVFVVPQNNSLKIIDSSEKKNGAVNGVHGAVSVTGGELSLSGGTLKAQAQASIESDDGELVVSILDNGIFKMDGGKIDFNGSLEDGRTYYDTSCSLYVDDLSVAYISANSIVKGEILTDDKWSLFIYGGTFDYDISDYVSKDMKVVKNGEVYTVEGIFSDKIDAIYHGMEIEAVVIPKKDTVNGDITEIELVVRPLSDVKERNQDGKICIELNDIIKEMRYLGDEYVPLNVSVIGRDDFNSIGTSFVGSDEYIMQKVFIDSENVGIIAHAAEDKPIFLEMEINIDEKIAENAENSKMFARYRIVGEDGAVLKTNAAFDVIIKCIDDKSSVYAYVEGSDKPYKKECEFTTDAVVFSAVDDEKIFFVEKKADDVVAENPFIAITGKTLDIRNDISMIFYTDIQGVKADKVKMLFWTSPQNEYTEETAERSVQYITKDANGYRFAYSGIASNEMNKKIYARIVAEDSTGNRIYGNEPTEGFSVVDFAQRVMDNSDVKPLMIKMLNYGTAAQEYFEDTDTPANAVLAERERVIDYTPVYRSENETISEVAKNGNSEAQLAGKTLSLEGNISINYYVLPQNGVDEIGMIFWTEEAFNNTEKHIIGTQVKKVTQYKMNGNYFVFNYDNIGVCGMDDSVYARVYVKKDGVYRYSDIDKYSIEDYVANQVEKNENPKLIKLLRAMMLYGKEAKFFYGNNK